MKLLRLTTSSLGEPIIINAENINYFKPYSYMNSSTKIATTICFLGDIDNDVVVAESFEEVVSLLESFEE